MVKLTAQQQSEIQKKVIEYISNLDEFSHFENRAVVVQRIYNEVTGNGQLDPKEKMLYDVLKRKTTPLNDDEKQFIKDCDNKQDTIVLFSDSAAQSYFSKEAREEGTIMKINRELSSLIKTDRVIYDDSKIDNALYTIKNCYGISDDDMRIVLALFSQIKLRIKEFAKTKDVRRVNGFNDFGIMPSFYGPQGCGKSEFASIIGKVIGNYKEHGVDDLLGSFGSEDVFYSPLVVMNEFGKQNKEKTDELKKYINGEKVTVNKKYEKPITANCFATLLLTSNFDPEMLKGTELGSRRICVVKFENSTPQCSKEEIEEAVRNIWENCDENTFENYFHITKEELARSNLEEQSEDEIAEFANTLTEEDIEFLSQKRTKKAITEYMKREHNYPISYVVSVLQSNLFDKKKYKTNKSMFYSLSASSFYDIKGEEGGMQ